MRIRGFRGLALAAAALMVLSACGGDATLGTPPDNGGGDPGPGPGPGPGDPQVSRIILTASAAQLLSSADSASEGITLTARALDADGSVIGNPPNLRFAIPPTAGELVPQSGDGTGVIRSVLTTGGDPSRRTITVTARSGQGNGGPSETIDIPVIGTALNVVGPNSIGFNQAANFSVRLLDADGGGIGGRTVEVSTSSGTVSAGSLTTAPGTGEVNFTITSEADLELTISALGITAVRQIQVTPDQFRIVAPASGSEVLTLTNVPITVEWLRNGSAAETQGLSVNFSSTRGEFAGGGNSASATLNANGQAAVMLSSPSAGGAIIQARGLDEDAPSVTVPLEFVAAVPAMLDLQVSPPIISTGDQSLIIATLRDANNNRVKNQRINFSLNDVSNGSLSAPQAVTNSLGIATVTYTASSASSAAGGVSVVASVDSDPGVNTSVSLTVGGRALRITLGTGNEIFELNPTTYGLPYTVLVTDAAGNPVPSAEFRLSVLPVAYGKGEYILVDTNGDGTPDAWFQDVSAVCANEDTNYDGIVTLAKDFNGNGTLEPGNVASVPNTIALDETGAGEFTITYPQDRANWVMVRLQAIARVQGTETTESAQFILPILASDVSNINVSPPGAFSPYGQAANCADPN